jgi:hypothetical protein
MKLRLLAALLVVGGSLHAQETTITSTVQQSGVRDDLGAGESARINRVTEPFTYANSGSLFDITSITITLTVLDGDTGAGPPPDPFRDTLRLFLDGIDTGILLNGLDDASDDDNPVFPGDYASGTETISGFPMNAAAILAALQSDGQLLATIYATAGDVNDGNLLTVPRFTPENPAQPIFATLSITGTAIPEPGTWALLALGAGIVGFHRRRRG